MNRRLLLCTFGVSFAFAATALAQSSGRSFAGSSTVAGGSRSGNSSLGSSQTRGLGSTSGFSGTRTNSSSGMQSDGSAGNDPFSQARSNPLDQGRARGGNQNRQGGNQRNQGQLNRNQNFNQGFNQGNFNQNGFGQNQFGNGTGQRRVYSVAVVAPDLPAPAPAAIEASATRALQVDRLAGVGALRVSVQGDSVVLEGRVNSSRDARVAAALLSLEPGVRNIDNRLEVVPADEQPAE